MALRLNGSNTGYVELDVPADAGSHTLILPDGGGTAHQVLKNSATPGTLEYGVTLPSGNGSAHQVLKNSATAGTLEYGLALPTGNGTSGQYLQTDGLGGSSWQTVTDTTTNLTRGTAQALSGSSEVTFSSLPSGIRRITLLIEELSTTVNFRPRIRVGTGGVVETTGYLGLTQYNNVRLSVTTEWPIYFSSNAAHFTGEVTIENITGNTWIQTHNGASRDWTSFNSGSGSISLSGVLDTVSISLDSGTFDDGTINIFYEV